MLLPLTKVAIRSELFGAFATSTFELTYVNPSSKHPHNCSFSFPMEEKSAVVDFEASIDERKIKTRVQTKEKARERFEDAQASGKAAVIAERNDRSHEKTVEVKLGNLLPKAKATIKVTIVGELEVEAGHYKYTPP